MTEQNFQENQDVEDELLLDFPVKSKKETNGFLLAIEEQAVENKIQQLFKINPKSWHDLKDKGRIPATGTYKDFLVALISYYRNKNEVALKKVELQQGKYTSPHINAESGLPKVVEAEKLQKIRLDRAKEQEVHLRNLASRMELVNKQELYELIAPLLGNIANILRSTADEKPELQPIIDKCFINLHTTGKRLIDQAIADKDHYVQRMLDEPVNLDELISEAEEHLVKVRGTIVSNGQEDV